MGQETLTSILHKNVKDAPSGMSAKEIAHAVGRDYQTLMSELSRQPNHKLGANLVLPLMKLTGSMEGLKYLAAGMNAVCAWSCPRRKATILYTGSASPPWMNSASSCVPPRRHWKTIPLPVPNATK